MLGTEDAKFPSCGGGGGGGGAGGATTSWSREPFEIGGDGANCFTGGFAGIKGGAATVERTCGSGGAFPDTEGFVGCLVGGNGRFAEGAPGTLENTTVFY